MKPGATKLVKPARLKPGDTLGIAAPASLFDRDRFSKGKAVLESMGFRIAVEDDVFLKREYLAGTDAQRADLINRLFADPAIKAIVCARGGFGSMRILSLLDYEAIRKHPKIFVGYSDISALLSVLYARCGLVAFHGPMVTTLADDDKESRDAMLAALTSDIKLELTPTSGRVIKPGRASGPVAGGNLTTLCHLVGTPFAPGFKGRILFLEDKGEAAYRIDRMLSQMKLAGCFDGLAGLMLGSFEKCGKLDRIYRIVAEMFSDVDIPVLAGFDIGHGRTNITIPLGIAATLDADRRKLIYHEPATV
ncbi:MAG: LD-carboxypeptidase [Pseudomonadota bacterium]|uniref:LD-carboxypeptidase n=1 Tax=Candidatus Desulfatibia profunda TaxID=2841695 RepID=A0A8J6TNE5_9BACT|nr:LD-carboxypeptidase [Candidatus Desulfatibia profunda]MBL7179379.1 LD-carboxypeptidase [Desulfobacterales bacterium]